MSLTNEVRAEEPRNATKVFHPSGYHARVVILYPLPCFMLTLLRLLSITKITAHSNTITNGPGCTTAEQYRRGAKSPFPTSELPWRRQPYHSGIKREPGPTTELHNFGGGRYRTEESAQCRHCIRHPN